MFGNKTAVKEVSITYPIVQAFVDKKVDKMRNSILSNMVSKSSHDKLINETAVLKQRLHKLEEFLGVEYSAEFVSGYKKVKKTKK